LALGTLVLSLDFELHWGVYDSRPLASYGANLLGVRQAIPAMLDLFLEFGVHATWATVGFLFHKTRSELLSNLPVKRPQYVDPALSCYALIDQIGTDEQSDPYHFAPSLIQRIMRTPGQEIGSHTYSHFFCMEPGADLEAFVQDIAAAKRVAAGYAINLRTLVFPRNQYTAGHLSASRRLGFDTYRGNAAGCLYRPRTKREATGTVLRGAKLVDAYLPLSGRNVASAIPASDSAPALVPASRFMRPYNPTLRHLEWVRLHRLSADMEMAARSGGIYHLWWHPHNVGINVPENMAFLRQILLEYSRLQREHGMRSLNMCEVADELAMGLAARASTAARILCAE
jgi:peptidoglycan/xylan/chitin deacetylase (PgdA/CDA1 family)